jgi:imidazoleglycerol phosphate synthase glutamine amidotransferase subunit HisH
MADDSKEHYNDLIKTDIDLTKKVVGVIVVPLSPSKKYYKVCGDGYIASAHLNWLERAGLEVLGIPFNTSKHKYYFERINALYLPSGGAFASTQQEYYECCKKFIQLAMECNNKGTYFPVWGGCMGMQQMMILGDGQDNLEFLDRFDSFGNLMLPLQLTKDGMQSRLINYLANKHPKLVERFLSEDCTLNNHMLGVSPWKFKRSLALNSLYKIVSWNYDRKGKKFVSTIEGRRYPFYGVQWHPERGNDMDALGKFFASEVKKNTHHKRVPGNKYKQYKKVHCMTYSGELYKYCNFYWFKRTSEHNKNLCNVLNLGAPANNSV